MRRRRSGNRLLAYQVGRRWVDLDAAAPTTPMPVIEEALRGRRLTGLVARMGLCFGAERDTESAPPPTDEDAPPLLL